MTVRIGHYRSQPNGYKAFVPEVFPPQEGIPLSAATQSLHAEAMRLLGKLDGITQLLPDKDFFLMMFVRKDAASSSQIEGTLATMMDAIEAQISSHSELPADVDDIIHYIDALNYGMERIEQLPISLRFISELHHVLMKGARSTHHSYPGEIRRSQNWIGGTSPQNASFVPPPVHELPRVIGELENFIHAKTDDYLPLVKAALIHAQFETIHPFADGNGRTGRMLITMYLWHRGLLEIPVLFLSDYFKRHQKIYYSKLQGYHSDSSDVEGWVRFFLDGVIETAQLAIEISREITQLREEDMVKIHKFGKVAAESAIVVLRNLYKQPIVDVAKVMEWTGYKTRMGAQKIIDRLVRAGILMQRDPHKTYGRLYEYRDYMEIFSKS